MSTAAPSFDNVKVESMTGILSHSEDKYDGVIINSHELPTKVDEFVSVLSASLAFWKSKKRRGIWLKVPIEQSELIAPAVAAGFTFHHAEKHYLMLNHWLSEEENRMPANATHQVGVGSVVIHDGKILAVQERMGPLRGTGIWKMPTGLSDAGEDLCDTAVREVKEETGIDTEFVSILCIRQSHTALFGKSDLFFVCLLRPKTTTIQLQPSEIAACEWIDAETFLSQKFFLKSPLFTVVNERVRAAVRAVAADPHWGTAISSLATATATATAAATEDGSSSASTDRTTTAGGVTVGEGKSTLPVPSLAASKLPNGIRPGESVLYHIPAAAVAGGATF
jgi:ADP-ribose pyrophosphatase YjhB (NUDIX family)